jgi:hypothetical protein
VKKWKGMRSDDKDVVVKGGFLSVKSLSLLNRHNIYLCFPRRIFMDIKCLPYII